MSTDLDSIISNDYALAKPRRRVREDSYAALREAADKRRAQNRIAQRNSSAWSPPSDGLLSIYFSFLLLQLHLFLDVKLIKSGFLDLGRRRMFENKQKQDSNESSDQALAPQQQQQQQHESARESGTTRNAEAEGCEYATSESSNSQSAEVDISNNDPEASCGPDQDSCLMPFNIPMSSAMRDAGSALVDPMLLPPDCNCNTAPGMLAFQQDDMISRYSHFPTPPEEMLHTIPLSHHDLLAIQLHESHTHPASSSSANMVADHTTQGISPPLHAHVPFLDPTYTDLNHKGGPLPFHHDDSLSETIQHMETDMRIDAPLPNVTTDHNNVSARLEYVLDCIQSAGFPNFDDVATRYYTERLDINSAADTEQKISRSRRLRDFLASLRQSSKRWTRWESRGYEREIIESAEEMYAAELEKLVIRLHDQANLSQTRSESDNAPAATDVATESNPVHLMRNADESSHQPSNGVFRDISMDMARFYQNEVCSIYSTGKVKGSSFFLPKGLSTPKKYQKAN